MPETKFDYLRVVQELLSLEEKATQAQLEDGDRKRYIELSKALFGISDILAEKRKYFRVLASLSAEVTAPDHDPGARVRSLSCGGFFVETECVPKVGSQMDVKVSFPERHEISLPFRVLVRWTSGAGGSEDPRGVGVSFVDLDERQRAAILSALRNHLLDNLERTLDRFEFFFEHSPDTSALITHETNIIALNEQARRMLAHDGADLKGSNLAEMLPVESARTLADAVAQVRMHGDTVRFEIELPQPEGKPPIPIEVLLGSGRSEELDLGVLFVGRDVTERYAIEEQRRKMERRLYQSDKLASLGRIAAGIAHDINNPLAWVLSNLSLIDGYTDPLMSLVTTARESASESSEPAITVLEEIDENLSDVIGESLQGVRRIRDIIRDLKMFSRVDVTDEIEVDVNEALETSLRIVRNQIEQRARVERDFGEIPSTYANFGKICQISLNLITNAIASFDAGEVEHNQITVRSRVVGDRIHVVVGDTGRGIPKELQKKIFEPFYTLMSDEGGTGLGLPITMDAIKVLNGELTIDSEVGRGTEFTVSLPIRERPAALAVADKKPSIPPQHRPRLLVVDDEVALLRAFQRSLKRRWDVSTATTVKQALEMFDAEPFEAILCDVMIPGTSGIAMVEELRKRQPGLEKRIIFMTGGAFVDREKSVLEKLPNVVAEKPFDIKDIESLLIDLISSEGQPQGLR